MKPVLVTPPAELPVTLEEAREVVRVDFDDDDASILSFLAAAVAHLDGYSGILGRCLVSQTWKQGFEAWAPCLRLPFPDVSSATVKYLDSIALEQTVDAGSYQLVEGVAGAEIVFSDDFTWPGLAADVVAPVRVEFVAGYGPADAVPEDIKLVIKALVRHWYAGQSGHPSQMGMLEKYRCRPI